MSFYCCLSYDDISGRVTIANVLLLVEITKYKYISFCFILFLSWNSLWHRCWTVWNLNYRLLTMWWDSMLLAIVCKSVVDNEVTCFPNTPFIVYVILMVHTKSNDCYTNVFGCESQVNIILLEFRSGWLSVSSSSIALSSSSKIITDRDFRDLSFERISFLLYLCSNRRSPLGLRELKRSVWETTMSLCLSQPAWAAWINANSLQ